MDDISIETTIDAKPAHVYAAFTNEVMLNQWLSNECRNDVRVNGYYHLYWLHGVVAAGIFRAVEPDARLVFSWFATGDPGETEIEVTFAAKGNNTALTIVHRGFGSSEEWMKAHGQNKTAWEQAADNLQYYMKTGLDQRVVQRPMIGFLPGAVDESRRASHDLHHVPYGVFVTSVVPGGGAEKAGIQPNDVIVSMDGVDIKDFYDMDKVIRKHKAGDTINATIWRRHDKLDLTLTFGQRPLPALPETHEALVTDVRATVEDIKRELDGILGGLTESEYQHKPSESEWSLKEQLAHLIVSERANSYFDWLAISGDSAYPFAINDSVQLALGGCNRETGEALLRELKQVLDENLAVVEALPQAVIENRALFLNLANILLFTGNHVRTHYDQMRATIASARTAAANTVPA